VAVPVHSDAIKLLRSESLATLVQQELERLILAGELEPGAKLREEDIAERLSVSRGPVREAFRALGQIGLVRIEKNRGVTVRELSVAEADEIYELRAGLDELIGRLAAQRIARDDLRRLRELVRGMEEAAVARNVDAYHPLNVEFHDVLAAATGNGTLLNTYRRLVKELHLYRRETLALAVDGFLISIREHKQIVDALARRNGALAGRLLYQHARASQARLHEIVAAPLPARTRAGAERRAR
jgi:phosphonate utilization transcriptional regulator